MKPTNDQLFVLNKVKHVLMERKNELWNEYYKYDHNSIEAIKVRERKEGIMEAIYEIDAVKDEV
jgi:hypothetical protein